MKLNFYLLNFYQLKIIAIRFHNNKKEKHHLIKKNRKLFFLTKNNILFTLMNFSINKKLSEF